MAPIHCATVKNHKGTVELLLQKEACDVNQLTEYGETPFQIACLNGHADLAKLVHCMITGGRTYYTTCTVWGRMHVVTEESS